MSIKAIIFDMDGVLIDSMAAHFSAWCEVLKPNVSLTRDEFDSWSGRSTANIFRIVQEKYGMKDDIDSFQIKKDEKYRELQSKVMLFANVSNTLAKLKDRELILGVATSEPTAIAERLLNKLDIAHYFSVVVGRDMVADAKPMPDLFLLAAKMLNVKPPDAMVLEDSFTGIDAARAAGMYVVGISTTHQRGELSRANVIISDIDELPGVVVEMLNSDGNWLGC